MSQVVAESRKRSLVCSHVHLSVMQHTVVLPSQFFMDEGADDELVTTLSASDSLKELVLTGQWHSRNQAQLNSIAANKNVETIRVPWTEEDFKSEHQYLVSYLDFPKPNAEAITKTKFAQRNINIRCVSCFRGHFSFDGPLQKDATPCNCDSVASDNSENAFSCEALLGATCQSQGIQQFCMRVKIILFAQDRRNRMISVAMVSRRPN